MSLSNKSTKESESKNSLQNSNRTQHTTKHEKLLLSLPPLPHPPNIVFCIAFIWWVPNKFNVTQEEDCGQFSAGNQKILRHFLRMWGPKSFTASFQSWLLALCTMTMLAAEHSWLGLVLLRSPRLNWGRKFNPAHDLGSWYNQQLTFFVSHRCFNGWWVCTHILPNHKLSHSVHLTINTRNLQRWGN